MVAPWFVEHPDQLRSRPTSGGGRSGAAVQACVNRPDIETDLHQCSTEAVANRLPLAQKTARQDLAARCLDAVLNQHDQVALIESEHRNIDGDVGTAKFIELSHSNQGRGSAMRTVGQLLEGGWQDRMVAESLVIPPNEELAVSVVCVEVGRWNGRPQHGGSCRRATTRVQAGLRAGGDRQREVWNRVSEYDAHYGRNATSSFIEHANRAALRVSPLVQGLRPFPGQIGVVIAIGGYPVSAELFDSPLTLAEQFQSIVKAAAMDAVGRRAEVTPSRRARRFIAGAPNVKLHRTAPAGAGSVLVGAHDDASVSLLRWRGRDVHTSVLNPRHELVRAS